MITERIETNGANGSGPRESDQVRPAEREAGPEVASAAADPRAMVDRIPRPRNARGDRLSTWGIYDDAHPEDLPAAATPLGEVLKEIRAERPARAARLEHEHEHDHELQYAQRRFETARHEAEAENAAWNERVGAANAAVDGEVEALRAEREEAIRPHREALEALDPELRARHAEAAARVAATGRTYDPANPSEEELLRVEPRDLRVLAAELKVPDPRADESALWPEWLGGCSRRW